MFLAKLGKSHENLGWFRKIQWQRQCSNMTRKVWYCLLRRTAWFCVEWWVLQHESADRVGMNSRVQTAKWQWTFPGFVVALAGKRTFSAWWMACESSSLLHKNSSVPEKWSRNGVEAKQWHSDRTLVRYRSIIWGAHGGQQGPSFFQGVLRKLGWKSRSQDAGWCPYRMHVLQAAALLATPQRWPQTQTRWCSCIVKTLSHWFLNRSCS